VGVVFSLKLQAKMPSIHPSLHLVVIMGSVRDGRMCDRVSKYVLKTFEKTTKMKLRVLDPAIPELSGGMNKQPLHFMQDPMGAPEWMQTMNRTIKNSQAIMMLTSEYNGMMPPALMNLMNTFPPTSFRHKPCGIVSYSMGTTGAMRALNVCRPYASELGMVVVPGYASIPLVHENINSEGKCKNEMVNSNLTLLSKNLEWYAQAIYDYHLHGHPHID